MPTHTAISSIIAMLLMISLAVVGSAVYYVAVTSYFRPQAGLSPTVTITVGASCFTTVGAQIVNTGGVLFSSVAVTITGSSSQLQIAYSSPLSPNGGSATLNVRGLSGGPYTAATPSTTVSGNLAAVSGSTYAVVVDGTMTNGATYAQAFSVQAGP
jgi:FlaG/FlaF family flagellin (archaellin)